MSVTVPEPLKLLALSPHRALLCGDGVPPGATDGVGTRPWVAKRFDAGPGDAADREAAWLRIAVGPGVVELLARTEDPTGRQPMLVMARVPGRDLQSRLLRDGPLPLDLALQVAATITGTLRRLAAIRCPEAPAGLLHGDIKPGNVMIDPDGGVVLVDFEHASALATMPVAEVDDVPGARRRFTGGTHGYAPPEAYLGADPSSAFDVFGLGCTLFEAVTGRAMTPRPPGESRSAFGTTLGPRGRAGDGLPEPLRALLTDCVADDPTDRPSLDALGERLERVRTALRDPAARQRETSRQAWLAGDLAAARTLADAADSTAEHRAWLRRAEWARALREPLLPDPRAPLDAAHAETLANAATQVESRRRWFPGSPRLRTARQQLEVQLAAALQAAAPRVAGSLEDGGASGALRTLAALQRTLDLLGPPRPSIAPCDDPPPPFRRDGAALLTALRRDVQRSRELVDRNRREFGVRLGRLDVDAARTLVEELGNRHGGSVGWIAELRDRLLRFEFYLQRVGRQTRLVGELSGLCEAHRIEVSLRAMHRLHARLGPLQAEEATSPPVEVRPRPLIRALRDLLREFPELEDLVQPALNELEDCCQALTRRAWMLAADADRRLATPPIPIRPLEQLLTRIDALIHADVVVDEEDRSRSGLIEEFESLRVRVDEARTARDRLAQGAQEAMDRGHLTTAIFDMERATHRFTDDGADDEAGPSLAQQFEEAQRRKQALEDALRRNHELAARCARLREDAAASPRIRLEALEEREQVLAELCRALPPDRRENHVADLRQVHVAMLRETDAEGRARLGRTHDPGDRLRFARETLDALQHAAPDQGWSTHDADEARRTLQRWIETVEQETERSRGRRVRPPEPGPLRSAAVPIGMVLAVGAIAAALLFTQPWNPPEAPPRFVDRLRTALGDATPLRLVDETLTFDPDAARARFEAFAATLAEADAAKAQRARELSRIAFDVTRTWSDFAGVVAALDDPATSPGIPHAASQPWHTYLSRVLRIGFAVRVRALGATATAQATALREALSEHTALRASLRADEAGMLLALLDRG